MQMPMMNVFTRDGDSIRHFWGAEMLYAPTDPYQDPRSMGPVETAWNLFDLMPQGRGIDWHEQLLPRRRNAENGRQVDMWVRATLGCRKIDGNWRIIHDQESVPFDPATGQAQISLPPQ